MASTKRSVFFFAIRTCKRWENYREIAFNVQWTSYVTKSSNELSHYTTGDGKLLVDFPVAHHHLRYMNRRLFCVIELIRDLFEISYTHFIWRFWFDCSCLHVPLVFVFDGFNCECIAKSSHLIRFISIYSLCVCMNICQIYDTNK